MAYNIKDVFYLSTSATITANTSGTGSSQLDLSAYIDPIARGRTKGTGLAIYKVHFSLLEDGGRPVRAADTSEMTISMQAGLGVGDNGTGTAFAIDSGTLGNTNALNMATAAYYGPGATANMNGFYEYVMPSTEVPYIVVRDSIALCIDVVTAFSDAATVAVRLECAQVSLDQATLNQLLRTQTV